MRTSKFTDSQIMLILKQAESGTLVAPSLSINTAWVMPLFINGAPNMAVWIHH